MKIEFRKEKNKLIIIDDGLEVIEIKNRGSKSTKPIYNPHEDFPGDLAVKILHCDITEIPYGLEFSSSYAAKEFEIID